MRTRIRKAKPGDLNALVEIERALFPGAAISRRSLARFICSRTAEVIVAEDHGRFAGNAIVAFRSGAVVARLYSLSVTSKAQGRGLGGKLLEAAEDAAVERGCHCLRLEVKESNSGAIHLYRKRGYVEFGRRAGYYEDGADALRLQKQLILLAR